MAPDLELMECALDALERQEVGVLVWGLVDSALAEAEVDEALDQLLSHERNVAILAKAGCTIDNAATLKQRMLEQGLMMAVPGRTGSGLRYRTRMAEGVRLFARLRQLFPGKHEGRDGWIGGATLVADYRLLWRPRRYPDRNLTAQEVLHILGQRVDSAGLLSAVGSWLSKTDKSWLAAQFQIEAAARILEGLDKGMPRGTMVAAGTGSGKTLAFYLPALSWLAAQKLSGSASGGVRILAVYPRNELLKDQLAEVFDQCRKYDDVLGRSGGTISMGVLFGPTPTTIVSVAKKWPDNKCPFFKCPSCFQDMGLQSDSVAERDARLVCGSCGEIVEGRHLRITRRAMQEDPPDILFTSVEMLNQRMSDSEMRHLFGLGPRAQRVPTLMLLDEVHLYNGTYGAQVAHLLRRWSSLTKRRTHFVGLSATIAEGKSFFASLVDMDPGIVEEITPKHEDMVEEGAEYMLALRGDPVSQSALLSTSIQALMLASRLLDSRQNFGQQRPFAGWRTFAFTDQVDATNRLFYKLRDAEGRTKEGYPASRRHPNGGLAHLRAPGNSLRRYEGGQDWRLAQKIGHDLSARQRVDRTTAGDSGVDSDAEIVVATAALEVGYDDPAVGVVLQHKAPRDMAQFLQRKGRAGRTRHMRPWTLMVLSDYGRDRMAYQAYEQFFDPELPPRELPLSNRYVRRMQATYALVDYLGIAMQHGEPAGSVWLDMSYPDKGDMDKWPDSSKATVRQLGTQHNFPLQKSIWKSLMSQARNAAPRHQNQWQWAGKNWLQAQLRRRHLVKLLGAILKDPTACETFAQHVSSSLGLPREEVDSLLWDHPRPLLLGALPTALRRLATNWRAHGQPRLDRAASSPLPEFAPPTLFSDLCLPEVRLVTEVKEAQEQVPALPVLQAMSEMAPGKVSRRLDHALWLGPGDDELDFMLDSASGDGTAQFYEVEVDRWYVLEPQLSFCMMEEGAAVARDAYRPQDLLLKAVPDRKGGQKPLQVLDTSNARLQWQSQLFGRRSGAYFASPADRVGIARLFAGISVYTHASQSAATVRRYATASKVNLRARRGQQDVSAAVTWRFVREGKPCGVGFEIEADALCFVLRLPESLFMELGRADAEAQRAARCARFTWEAVHGDALTSVEQNPFMRGWLAQIFQVAACAVSLERDCDLSTAFDVLTIPAEAQRLRSVLSVVFQSLDAPEDDEDEEESGAASEPRLKKALSDATSKPEVLQALRALALKTLSGPIDETWDRWLGQTWMQTLGAALLDAILEACPQVDTDDLVVDIDPGPLEDGSLRSGPELWISESNPGGNGLIEQVVEVIATDAVHFFRRVEAALLASEFEQIDLQLRDYVRRIGQLPFDDDLVELTYAVRNAESSGEARAQLAALRSLLPQRGHAVFHGYVAALSNRILRPNTPAGLDTILCELIQRWGDLEARIGVEVDSRVMCALFSSDARVDDAFAEAGFDLPATNRESWRFGMLLGIVWARGHAVRSSALALFTRFVDSTPATERLLLASWLSAPDEPILASDPEWLSKLRERLTKTGRAAVALGTDAKLLNEVMCAIVCLPVQLEYLNVYPRLVSVVRQQGDIQLQLELEAAV